MNNKKYNKYNNKKEEMEDATKYGEFISSFFGWETLSNQKKRADELNDMTKKIKKK